MWGFLLLWSLWTSILFKFDYQIFINIISVGTRNNSSSTKNSFSIGGNTNRLKGWSSDHGKASQDKTKASVAGARRETSKRAQGSQIRWVLSSHTGIYIDFIICAMIRIHHHHIKLMQSTVA